jgi:hypothetical protein
VIRQDAFARIPVGPGDFGIGYNFAERDRPECCIRSRAFTVGAKVARDVKARNRDPERFDREQPAVGRALAAGRVPRGVDGYPAMPRVFRWVPLIGTKRLVYRTDPETGRRELVGIPNFPQGPVAFARRRRG